LYTYSFYPLVPDTRLADIVTPTAATVSRSWLKPRIL